uniref:BTB domain-containing protein n=1 Tax=Heterorhabditis bacteriophora TaxID=37862 RepID=A0A1I7W6Y5_HETBA
MIKESSTLDMNVELLISESYFSITTLVNLELHQPSTIESVERVIRIILNGDKPAHFDWVITVGQGSPREFFVHRKVLANSSPILDNRFILPMAHSEDMKVILTYFYLQQIVLPSFDSFARIGRIISTLLPRTILSKFFESWEIAIINDVIKLDWQMAKGRGEHIDKEIDIIAKMSNVLHEKILFSINKFRTAVSGVRKIKE